MTANEIAKAFIGCVPQSAIEDGEGITQLKLQKLLFLAQEEHLYRNGEPLFSDKIEAWEHGPVVKSIWNEYNIFGKSAITLSFDTSNIKNKALETVQTIWEKYGLYDAWYLRDLTHEYKTWKDNFNRDETYHTNEITPQEILKYRREREQAKKQAKHEADEAFSSIKDLVLL